LVPTIIPEAEVVAVGDDEDEEVGTAIFAAEEEDIESISKTQ
jgi:hypothetical protein